MGTRAVSAATTALVAACVSAALFCGVASAAEGCPNEARREEQNATYLPDCRAYEMVSPLDKNGSDVDANGTDTFSSLDGESVVFGALAGFSETQGAGNLGFTQYMASREGTRWSVHGVTPRPSRETYQFTVGATTLASFSEDLSHALVEGYNLPDASGGVPKGINYYRENAQTGGLETITTPLGAPLGVFESALGMWGTLRGYSPDLQVVTFENESDFLAQTLPGGPKLYQWEDGKLTLAGILPDGTAPAGGSGAAIGQGLFSIEVNDGTVTDEEGSRVAFVSPMSGSANQQLYLRRDATSTAWVSESEASTPDPEPANVKFRAMSANGRRILFTSTDRLTNAAPEDGGLYMYTDGPAPQSESNLLFLAGAGATVVAFSEDGTHIYIEGTPEGFTEKGVYLWDEGSLHFVTSMDLSSLAAEDKLMTPDGRKLAFISHQMYLYDEAGGSVTCVSCLPGGKPNQSDAKIVPESANGSFVLKLLIHPRFLTRDGRYVFFSTSDSLVARDTDGVEDAYEYDTQTGSLSLLSSGSSEAQSWFAASNADGGNVFILTRQPLVRGDTDTLIDLYDVRAGGGFPEPPPPTGPCQGDECQGTPSAAPSFATASGFAGLGNTPPSEKVPVKSKAKTLTRSQKLARALKACKAKKPKRARQSCQRSARKKYGARKAKRSGAPARGKSSDARR